MAGDNSAHTQAVCPACGAGTDAGARFCPSCGQALVASCPSCGAETKVGTQFCAACGHRLDRTVATEEERKLVTVLFADLTGSTALGERLDPEHLRALLSEYFAAMASVIESWGGAVEKFIGDAVMSVFGIPTAHEDDAERALRAALEMQARLAEMNATIAERHGVELRMRIGVNSGEAIAGPGGDQLMVTGDVVNVASRLHEAAAADEVVAGERTYVAARGAFVFEPLDDKLLKGKSLPVRAWRVVATAQLARPRGIPGIATRLVGRDREIRLLETIYQGSVEECRPALVTILGHAGVGKTRLTEEFVAAATSGREAPSLYRGRCLPYGEGITFWALREILWAAAGILLDDAAETAAVKLETLVRSLFEGAGVDRSEVDRVLFALATTAGIVVTENPLDKMSPESIGEELGLAWPRFLSALASHHPTLVVIEDVHRGEPPLLDMIEHLVSRSSGPAFILATGRPELAEVRPGWSARPGMSQISLEPLVDSQTEQLLEELLPRVGSALRRRILAAAEGNPLFAEEIVAHLIDEGVLAREPGGIVEVMPDALVTIPDTVRALLAARVDALPVEEKRTLQDAAVVGRIFWTTTLESIRANGVRPILRMLEDKGFVVTRPVSSLPGQTEVAFRHGLVRDVAYESIPKGRRARSHAEVGRWIEELAGDRRDEYVDLIAYHYESAARREDSDLAWPGDTAYREEVRKKAIGALLDAGQAATKRFAIDQALGFGDRVLGLATTDVERLAGFKLKAHAAHAGVRADEGWSNYVEAIELAERLGDRVEGQRLRADATLLWSRYAGAFTGEEWKAKAVEVVRRGLGELGEGDVSFEVGALLVGRCGFRFWKLAPRSKEEARRDAEQAVAVAEAIGSQRLLSYALDNLAMEVAQSGFCESADFGRRALAVARSLEDRGEAHELLVTAAIELANAGRFAEAVSVADEAAVLAAQLGPHRSLHAGSAQTRALLPLGLLAELREATARAADLVAEEGMHTCFHGLMALAGQSLSASELGSVDDAKRALDIYDTAAVSRSSVYAYRTIEILRPFVGVEEARRRLQQTARAEGTDADVARLRLELQLSALERDWEALPAISDRARSLARSACAPYLDWIADWAQAARLAGTGRPSEATTCALSAASALDVYGERYLAARLLVDLVPLLDGDAAGEIAGVAIPRLDGLGAGRSARELKRWVSTS